MNGLGLDGWVDGWKLKWKSRNENKMRRENEIEREKKKRKRDRKKIEWMNEEIGGESWEFMSGEKYFDLHNAECFDMGPRYWILCVRVIYDRLTYPFSYFIKVDGIEQKEKNIKAEVNLMCASTYGIQTFTHLKYYLKLKHPWCVRVAA